MNQHPIKHTFFLLLLFGSTLILAPFTCVAQKSDSTNPSIKAFLKTNKDKNEAVEVTGTVKNFDNEALELRYEMSVTVSNKKTNDFSMSAHSGTFILHPFEIQDLSQTSVLTGSGSQSIVLLAIYKGPILLRKTKKVYGSTE